MNDTTTVHEEKPVVKKQGIFLFIIAFLASKGAVLLKALKALKFAKFAITAITMSISALLYGFAFGSWYFAVGLVLMLLIHEYGHVIAMWKKGIHASAPVFIPFLGALIYAKLPENKDDEAYIGFGGPLIGSIVALICIAIAFLFPAGTFWSTLLHIVGNVGLFINLFNLIPARPLDGGRILHPIGSGMSYIGFGILVFCAYILKDWVFLILALIAVEDMPVRKWIRQILWSAVWFYIAFDLYVDFGFNFISAIFLYFLCGLGILMLKKAWNSRHESLPDVVADQESSSLAVKVKWLTCYSVLLAVIVGAMMWQTAHLPKEVRESSLVKFVHEL